MIPVLTAAEMGQADRRTIEEIGIPGAVLMENAGSAVAAAVRRRYPETRRPVVLCDGLVNRTEFPLLDARRRNRQSLVRRAWSRIAGSRLYPGDARWLRQLAPAVLHSHFGYTAVDDLPLHAALERPWVVSFYGADAYQRESWQEAYAQVFDRATRILALGPAMARNFLR